MVFCWTGELESPFFATAGDDFPMIDVCEGVEAVYTIDGSDDDDGDLSLSKKAYFLGYGGREVLCGKEAWRGTKSRLME